MKCLMSTDKMDGKKALLFIFIKIARKMFVYSIHASTEKREISDKVKNF